MSFCVSFSASSFFVGGGGAQIQVAKRALVPSPVCVLALGDPRNRCGELGMEYLGCAEDDLRALADGRMKRTLQVRELQGDDRAK